MVILDAYNIIHAAGKSRTGRLDLAGLHRLIAVSRWRSEAVVLVIDGPGPRGGEGRRTLRRAVDVDTGSHAPGTITEVFAASGGGATDADSVIEALLERESHFGRARTALVVSSDRQVRAAATGVRAQSMSSEDFLHRLAEDAARTHRRASDETGGRPSFAQDGGMDAGRTEYWLREFGLKAGGPPEPERSEVTRPAAGEEAPRGREDSAREPDPDDVDMREILRTGPAKPPPREDGDVDAGKKGKRPRRS